MCASLGDTCVSMGSPQSRAEPGAFLPVLYGKVTPGSEARAASAPAVPSWVSGRPTSQGLYGMCFQGREVGACIHLYRHVQWKLPQALAPPVLGGAWWVQGGLAWAFQPQWWGGLAGSERGQGGTRRGAVRWPLHKADGSPLGPRLK